jgi:hypothetical protein
LTLAPALRLRVGGLTLSVSSDGPRGCLRPPATHRAFLAARGHDIRLQLSTGRAPRPAAEDLAFESGGPWRVFRFEGGWHYQFLVRERGRWRHAEGLSVDEGVTSGRLFQDPGQRRRFALAYPVDELLFHHRLALDGHVVLHACGLGVFGGAILLCGESGAGKSTSARLWARHRPQTLVLSDDRVVVRRDGKRLTALGTPWHGEARFAAAAARPLRGVFFIEHARTTAVRRLGAAEAAGRLFTRSFPPLWRQETVARTLDACATIAESVPCHELRFLPDRSAVEAVLATVAR